MELWDIYDKNRNKTGKTMIRGQQYKDDSYHLVVHVCIFNGEGKMLIQQRQPFKEGWPDLWDITVGGSAVSGESSEKAAEREVLEEIGYNINLKGIRPSLTVNFDNGFDDIYLVNKEIDINKLSLQYEEVQDVKWADKKEIMTMIDNKSFIPYYKSFIELLFNMKDYLGVHLKEEK